MVLGRDPVTDEVEAVLALLRDGVGRDALRETVYVDLKEEPGRRGRGGQLQSATSRSERAAEGLAEDAACMANSDGGGALIVGIADDDGALLGTNLDEQWLRSRIYELTERRLTVDVQAVDVSGSRLLVIRSLQALEPIRWRGRVKWRVDDKCVEIDATTWHSRRMTRERFDWSEQSSFIGTQEVHAAALSIARRHMRASGEPSALDLASAGDQEMLRRLNAVDGEGYLTNAGALTFIGRESAALDYVRRTVPAGDSRRRLRAPGLSLLEEIDAVESAVDAFNEDRHIRRGFVIGRLKELPMAAVREAVVNGLVHRDWASPSPTLVEHVGRTLTVTSPGGFVGGVNSSNIITHPSQPRHRALAELFANLRIAEREGVGVDRMVRDMVAVGYALPSIEEIPGPHVRAALLGDDLDEAWIRFLARLEPAESRDSLTVLLILRTLVSAWWIDVTRISPVLQLNPAETAAAIRALERVTIDEEPLISPVEGIPGDQPTAWHMTPSAWRALEAEDGVVGRVRRHPERAAIALHWATSRGRISSTELSSILGLRPQAVNRLLQALREQEQLEPSRASGTGRGFYYRPLRTSSDGTGRHRTETSREPHP